MPSRGSGNQLSAAASSSVEVGDNVGVASRGSANQSSNNEPNPAHLRRANSTGDMSDLDLGLEEVDPPDPTVPVFNISVDIVRKCLWKGQVGQVTPAEDVRGVLCHPTALLLGPPCHPG